MSIGHGLTACIAATSASGASSSACEKKSGAVVLAFHMNYWDYIGWVDRFATSAYNVRQCAPMATSNSPTYGRPNSPGQDALIIS
ncbi:MAG: DUF1223 domain-containing protein [Rhodocyclaceae bacterium]|nr:DUF1223 domain-containing protein [Rhodocyclaceae bacterium]